MKERPILFSAPMVRAILAGTKTQTRRVVKPQPHHGEVGRMVNIGGADWAMDDGDLSGLWSCPYGQPGDRLWVRETFSALDEHRIHYRADYANNQKGDKEHGVIWTPPIHMPRWASRITLEVTGVRVDRLQDISEADAIAEGARRFEDIPVRTPRAYGDLCRWSMESPRDTDECLSSARMAFANLFCKVNGKRVRGAIDFNRWDSNPLVWVVEFRRIP